MEDNRNDPGPAWLADFVPKLAKHGSIRRAARAMGRSPATINYHRQTKPAFAAAVAAMQAEIAERGGPGGRLAWKKISPKRKRKDFLAALVQTSNITASARRAALPLRQLYKLRRRDASFAAGWRMALLEGYDTLEMELLGHLRDPAPKRKVDVSAALRLLAAHRDSVARERALREDDDEEAVLESIDRFIEDMRDRREANAALLLEYGRSAEQDDGHAAG